MCTKVRFAKRALAVQRIDEIKKTDSSDSKKPIRDYYCRECGGYHLTSQPMPKQKREKIKKRKEFFPERIATEWVKKNGW